MPTPKISRRDVVKFRVLLAKWKQETRFQSMTSQIIACLYYQEIIAMGRDVAVPLILCELRRGETHHLFPALRELTGEDPVLSSHRGNVESMAGDWIRWGMERGLIG